MHYFYPLLLFLPLFLLWLDRKKRKKIIQRQIQRKKQAFRKDTVEMTELAKRLLGKDCLIYTLDGTQLSGKLKEVSDHALLIDNGKGDDIVNLDYVFRIREYPTNSKGKKKSVVLD